MYILKIHVKNYTYTWGVKIRLQIINIIQIVIKISILKQGYKLFY